MASCEVKLRKMLQTLANRRFYGNRAVTRRVRSNKAVETRAEQTSDAGISCRSLQSVTANIVSREYSLLVETMAMNLR